MNQSGPTRHGDPGRPTPTPRPGTRPERTRRSLHVQRSRVLRFPDLVRAEIVALGAERSGLILDSRARFGCWDLGVNRRRVLRWVHNLQQITARESGDR